MFPVPSRSPYLFFLSILLLTAATRLPAVQEVPVALEQRKGIERAPWPVSVNVPFARGVLAKGSSLTLTRGGKEIPTQARTILEWPDGSARWVRLDGVLPARSSGKVTVKAGVSPAPPSVLRIVEGAEGVTVDTGAIVFDIPRGRFGVAENLRLSGDASPVVVTSGSNLIADGDIHAAGPPETLKVVSSGPVHGEIELRGRLGPDFIYLVRIAVDAGSALVRILHTYTKVRGRMDSQVERLSIDLSFASERAGRYSAGRVRAKPLTGKISGDAAAVFAQVDGERYGMDGEPTEGRLAGWFEVASDEAALGLASRWFWQEYPKAVAIGSKGLTFDLWSPRGGKARIGLGSAKTHELVLWAAPRGLVGKRTAPAVATPLRGFVDPSYLASTKALRGAIDPRPTSFDKELLQAAGRYHRRNAREKWADCGKDRCNGNGAAVVRVGAYGMLNWGDWNFPGARDSVKGTDAWGNLEYDTTQVLALTHAATADPVVFDRMEAAARHFMDVDTIHALPARPEWVGMNHPKNPRHFSFELGGVDLGHTWNEGLLSYYLMTGDRRGLEVAVGIADYLARRLRDFLRGNPRQWGWPQIALVAAYDVTGEKRYLEAARAYATSGMRAHPPSAGKWKMGILADALAHTHAYAGGDDIEKWLRQYAALVKKSRPRDSRFYPALAYIGRVAGEPDWTELAAAKVDRLDLGNWGKPFTIQGRVGLRIESLVQAGR